MTPSIQNNDTRCAAPCKTEQSKNNNEEHLMTHNKNISSSVWTEKKKKHTLNMFFALLYKATECCPTRTSASLWTPSLWISCFHSEWARLLCSLQVALTQRRQKTNPRVMNRACPSDCSFMGCPSNLEQGRSSTNLVTAPRIHAGPIWHRDNREEVNI